MAAGDEIQAQFRALKAELTTFKGDFEEFKGAFGSFVAKTDTRFDKLYELVDGVAGEFRKFDEEQTVLAGRQSDHSDRIEKLEEKVFGQMTA